MNNRQKLDNLLGGITSTLSTIAENSKSKSSEKINTILSWTTLIISTLLGITTLIVAILAMNSANHISTIANQFSDDHQSPDYILPADKQFSVSKIYLKNSSQPPLLLSPWLSLNLDRNNGGKAQRIFFADFTSENDIILTPVTLNNNFDPAADKVTLPNSLTIAESDEAIKNQIAYFSSENNSNSIIFHYFDSRVSLQLLGSKPVSKFIIIQGEDNSYEIISFIQLLGKKEDNYKDIIVSFNNIDLFAEKSWESQLKNVPNDDQNKIKTIKKTTQDNYTKLNTFIKEKINY